MNFTLPYLEMAEIGSGAAAPFPEAAWLPVPSPRAVKELYGGAPKLGHEAAAASYQLSREPSRDPRWQHPELMRWHEIQGGDWGKGSRGTWGVLWLPCDYIVMPCSIVTRTLGTPAVQCSGVIPKLLQGSLGTRQCDWEVGREGGSDSAVEITALLLSSSFLT